RPAHAAVVGLANSYLQYVTTRREYELQGYEGASTLYGPLTGEYFERRSALLARALMGQRIDSDLAPGDPREGEAVAVPYETSPERARLPPRSPWSSALIAARGAEGLCRLPSPGAPSLCFWWADGPPGRVALDLAPWLGVVDAMTGAPVRSCREQAPLAPRVESSCDPGAHLDDRGLAFQTAVRARTETAWLWSSVVR